MSKYFDSGFRSSAIISMSTFSGLMKALVTETKFLMRLFLDFSSLDVTLLRKYSAAKARTEGRLSAEIIVVDGEYDGSKRAAVGGSR